jgi:hypothetical protein
MSDRNQDVVTDIRVNINKEIADALLPSIFAGHLLFSNDKPLAIIETFQHRFADRGKPAIPKSKDAE